MQMSLIGAVVTSTVVGMLLCKAHMLSEGDAGMILQYATMFIGLVQTFFRSKTMLEVSMNDVERVDEYSNQLPLERYAAGEQPPVHWPHGGEVIFEDVRLQYATASKPIFNSLSFAIPSRSRVGVVGRTGAGKSSLAVALLRIVELSSGTISIDGIDISKLELGALRKRVTLVAQDPVLLRGTVRYNIWPLGDQEEYHPSDETIMRALTHTGLHEKFASLPEGLNTHVSEGGSNLSAGERQLLCMARALIRSWQAPSQSSCILLMDEATASVDSHADARVQDMIRSCFCSSTVITIAHRLHTIAFYEYVLVLANGEKLEFDSPANLLKCPDGEFHRLAKSSGDLEQLLRLASNTQEEHAECDSAPSQH